MFPREHASSHELASHTSLLSVYLPHGSVRIPENCPYPRCGSAPNLFSPFLNRGFQFTLRKEHERPFPALQNDVFAELLAEFAVFGLQLLNLVLAGSGERLADLAESLGPGHSL